MEIWKQVPSLRGVTASSLGRIMREPSIWRGRTKIFEPTLGSVLIKQGGYKKLVIKVRGGGTFTVARLVASAFHGCAPFEGAYVLHINENSLDNRPENLKWGTPKENMNTPKYLAKLSQRMKDGQAKIMLGKRWNNE